MSRLTMLVLALAVLATVTACSSMDPATVVVLRTDRSLYQPGDPVVLTISNVAGRDVFYTCPNALFLERRRSDTGEWQLQQSPTGVCQLVGFTLRASDSVELRYVIPEGVPAAARYRLEFGGFAFEVPAHERFSNDFGIDEV